MEDRKICTQEPSRGKVVDNAARGAICLNS
jgi:hypothetical protein